MKALSYKNLSYIAALFMANMKGHGPERKKLFIMSFFMMVQNSMFFALWVIFFDSISQLKGWRLDDVVRLFGVTSCAIGLSLFFFNGVRGLAYRIQDGSLDGLIAKPRAVLPALLLSASSPASLGDILYGPLLCLFLGHMDFAQWALFGVLTLNAAVIFTACTIVIYSIAFWLKGSTRFPDQLFEMMVILSCNIVHGQPFIVRLVCFSVLPAGFIGTLPVEILRSFDPLYLAIIVGATVFYAWIAVKIFNAGLRRYTNALYL